MPATSHRLRTNRPAKPRIRQVKPCPFQLSVPMIAFGLPVAIGIGHAVAQPQRTLAQQPVLEGRMVTLPRQPHREVGRLDHPASGKERARAAASSKGCMAL